MTATERIKETKNDGYYIECKLEGDGTDANPYQPEVFSKFKAYYHLDTRDIDYTNKTAKVWVSKKKSPPSEITKIKADATITKIKETTGGVEK